MDSIHQFFMGYPYAPYRVAEYIEIVANMIRQLISSLYRSIRMKQPVYDLEELAGDVRGGAYSSVGSNT